MKLRLLLLLMLGLTLGFTASAQTAPPAKTHRVIFGVTSGEEIDWNITLGNTRNLIAGLKPDVVQVEIVAYSQGINMIKNDSTVAADIVALQKQGVVFVACQNAMRAHKLELKDLLPGVTPVPAGIVEVVTKQEQGWTYIKGGR
jgi:intracellular sulfur oxidation DsrE/DsrF family protein